jgi:hypothetical protein
MARAIRPRALQREHQSISGIKAQLTEPPFPRHVNLLAGSATVSLGAFPDVALTLAEVFV